jgi:hypothetical protein
MAERLITVYDVWIEYTVGLNGGPAIRKLLTERGNKWRVMSSKEKKTFERRIRICKLIEKLITEGRSEKDAQDDLEVQRAERALTTFADSLKKSNQKL